MLSIDACCSIGHIFFLAILLLMRYAGIETDELKCDEKC